MQAESIASSAAHLTAGLIVAVALVVALAVALVAARRRSIVVVIVTRGIDSLRIQCGHKSRTLIPGQGRRG